MHNTPFFPDLFFLNQTTGLHVHRHTADHHPDPVSGGNLFTVK